ncbi:hypothetical protein ACFQL4_06660 [Halosimplex aquaticum]
MFTGAALGGPIDAQANDQLLQEAETDGSPISVAPGVAGTTNDFTFTLDLSGNASEVEVESAWIDFGDSGVNGTALKQRVDSGESEITATANGTSIEFWGSTTRTPRACSSAPRTSRSATPTR